MQTPEIILAAIVLVPLILLMLLRVNAALVFLSLCLGNVLVQFVARDANSLLDLFAKSGHAINATNLTIKLVLLLLPVVLTFVFMIRTVRGQGKLVLNIFPAAGVGLLGAFLVVPLLPGGISHNIVHSPLWGQAQRAQSLIVGVATLVCLLVLWLQRPKTGHDDKHGKHKH